MKPASGAPQTVAGGLGRGDADHGVVGTKVVAQRHQVLHREQDRCNKEDFQHFAGSRTIQNKRYLEVAWSGLCESFVQILNLALGSPSHSAYNAKYDGIRHINPHLTNTLAGAVLTLANLIQLYRYTI
jgi:hypothetical protein